MALEGVGLGLALLSELTKYIRSMQERTACYKDGPALFGQVDGTLARLNDFANTLSGNLRTNPHALSQAVLPDFVATLETVKDTLRHADDAVTVYCLQAFFGNSSSSRLRELTSKGSVS